MKHGRPKGDFDYPHNYTYVMFDFIDKNSHKCLRALMPDRAAAKQKAKSKKVSYRPTKISALTEELGRAKTHRYLKKFGPTWIVKGGHIYFEKT